MVADYFGEADLALVDIGLLVEGGLFTAVKVAANAKTRHQLKSALIFAEKRWREPK